MWAELKEPIRNNEASFPTSNGGKPVPAQSLPSSQNNVTDVQHDVYSLQRPGVWKRQPPAGAKQERNSALPGHVMDVRG